MLVKGRIGHERADHRPLAHTKGGRIVIFTGIVLVVAAGLGLVLASPFALRELSTIHGFNWAKLSNIGQAYGAAATLLSALALGGVTAALFVQAKQTKTAQEQAARTIHLELVRMAIENPDLGRAIGFRGTEQNARQLRYLNLWMNYWRSMYRLGYMNEADVRSVAAHDVFQNAMGREMWERSMELYTTIASDRRTKGFLRIFDDEYRKLAALGTPSLRNDRKLQQTDTIGGKSWLATVALLGVGAGAFLYRAYTRNCNRGN